jgi:hypothetical protein
MNPKFWRIQQYDAVGVSVKTIGMTAPIQSFNSLRLRGDGSCEEGSFTALVSALDINPRDILVIEASEDNSSWTPIYSGVVTSPGAKRSFDVSQVLMVGLNKRISEVVVDEQTYASNDLAVVVRSIAQSFLPDGVIYDAALIPDVNFTIGVVKTQFNYLNDIFTTLAQTAPGFVVPVGQTYTYDGITYEEFETVPPMTWGVLPNRKFFFKRVTGISSYIEEVDDVKIEYDAPSAEDICTRVIFYAVDGVTFRDGIAISKPNLVNLYGEVSKVLTVSAGPEIVDTISSISTVGTLSVGANGQTNFNGLEATNNSGSSWTTYTNSVASYLSDNNSATRVRLRIDTERIGSTDSYSVVGFPYGMRVSLSANKFVESITIKGKTFEDGDAPLSPRGLRIVTRRFDSATGIATPFANSTTNTSGSPTTFDLTIPIAAEASAIDVMIEILAVVIPPIGQTSPGFSFYDAYIELETLQIVTRPLLFNAADRIAESLFKAPVLERVEIQKPGVEPPVPKVNVEFLSTSPATLDVAEIEYSITTQGGFETMFRLGQGINAELLAQAALINRKTSNAGLNVFDVITRVP